MESASSKRRLKILGTIVKWLAIGAILSLIARVFLVNLPELKRHPIECDPGLVALSVILFFLHLMAAAGLWHLLTKANNIAIPFRAAVVAWFFSMLGKYVPGKILLWAGRVHYYRQAGKSVKMTTFCFTIEAALQMLAAGIVSGVALAFSPYDALFAFRPAIWAATGVLLFGINPRILEFVINRGLKLLNKETISIALRQRDMAALLLGYVLDALLIGLAFFCFVNSLCNLSTDFYLLLTGMLLIAGWAGILALFAPAGLGVRDGILLVGLQLVVPDAIAALVVIAARIWMTAAELFGVFIVVVLLKKRGRQDQSEPPRDAEESA